MANKLFTAFAFPVAATNAVARTTPARLADQVNVLEFGADPNFVLNSQPAFTAAIAAATRTSKACGVVYVPRGSYKIDSAVSLLPGGPGASNSFVIRGESPACTQLSGNFAGYILDAGSTPYDEGGFVVENLLITNYYSAAPFVSGCIRMGGIAPQVRNCILGSNGISLNFKGAKAARVCDTFFSHGGVDKGGARNVGNIGVNMAVDGGVIENCSAQSCDRAFVISGTGVVMQGIHVEVCRLSYVYGYDGSGVGYGYAYGMCMLSTSNEACGGVIDIVGPTSGFFAGFGGQMHGQADSDINPDPSSGTYDDSALFGMRVQDGCSRGISFFDGAASTGDIIDPTGAPWMIGVPAAGYVRTNAVYIRGSVGNAASNVTPGWKLPGSMSGGAAVAGAANAAKLVNCDIVPIWQYNDLAWGTLTSASISNGAGGAGTTLSYSSATRLTLEVGAYIKGTGVTPGTYITAILTSTSATVSVAQNVSSTTITFFCNNPGDTYDISDGDNPVWTGSVSNAGRLVAGGGANRITVMFKETEGYVIVG